MACGFPSYGMNRELAELQTLRTRCCHRARFLELGRHSVMAPYLLKHKPQTGPDQQAVIIFVSPDVTCIGENARRRVQPIFKTDTGVIQPFPRRAECTAATAEDVGSEAAWIERKS